jgi:hypothetical protein
MKKYAAHIKSHLILQKKVVIEVKPMTKVMENNLQGQTKAFMSDIYL